MGVSGVVWHTEIGSETDGNGMVWLRGGPSRSLDSAPTTRDPVAGGIVAAETQKAVMMALSLPLACGVTGLGFGRLTA